MSSFTPYSLKTIVVLAEPGRVGVRDLAADQERRGLARRRHEIGRAEDARVAGVDDEVQRRREPREAEERREVQRAAGLATSPPPSIDDEARVDDVERRRGCSGRGFAPCRRMPELLQPGAVDLEDVDLDRDLRRRLGRDAVDDLAVGRQRGTRDAAHAAERELPPARGRERSRSRRGFLYRRTRRARATGPASADIARFRSPSGLAIVTALTIETFLSFAKPSKRPSTSLTCCCCVVLVDVAGHEDRSGRLRHDDARQVEALADHLLDRVEARLGDDDLVVLAVRARPDRDRRAARRLPVDDELVSGRHDAGDGTVTDRDARHAGRRHDRRRSDRQRDEARLRERAPGPDRDRPLR